jgi:hypothetical protein
VQERGHNERTLAVLRFTQECIQFLKGKFPTI